MALWRVSKSTSASEQGPPQIEGRCGSKPVHVGPIVRTGGCTHREAIVLIGVGAEDKAPDFKPLENGTMGAWLREPVTGPYQSNFRWAESGANFVTVCYEVGTSSNEGVSGTAVHLTGQDNAEGFAIHVVLHGVTFKWRHRLCRCFHFSLYVFRYVVRLGFTTSCRRTFERNLRSLVSARPFRWCFTRFHQDLGWLSCLRSPTFRHAVVDHYVIRVSPDISASFFDHC